jgi:hypothetical protein
MTAQAIQHKIRNERMIINLEQVTCFKVLLQHLPGETEEIHKNPS